MRLRIFAAVVLLVTEGFVHQSQTRSSEQEVEKRIVLLEKRLWDADVSADPAARDLVAEDFEGIKHGLLFSAKDDALAAKAYKLQSYSITDEHVRLIQPDVALLTYRVT